MNSYTAMADAETGGKKLTEHVNLTFKRMNKYQDTTKAPNFQVSYQEFIDFVVEFEKGFDDGINVFWGRDYPEYGQVLEDNGKRG